MMNKASKLINHPNLYLGGAVVSAMVSLYQSQDSNQLTQVFIILGLIAFFRWSMNGEK